MATRPILVAEVLKQHRLPAFEAMQQPVLFDQVVKQLGYPAKPPVKPDFATKRERHRNYRLTKKLWQSLVYDPVTGIATLPAPVPFDTPTDELPTLDDNKEG